MTTDSLKVRFGAVTLVLVTLMAVVFSIINFYQRKDFKAPDDGVTWLDSPTGVVAWNVAPGSPAASAGIKPGDQLLTLDGARIQRATDVTERLWRAGLWSEVHYTLSRQGASFRAQLVTAEAAKPFTIESALRVVGLVYLFIGLFIFARRWSAPRAVHFYLFCLVSFILYSFHYSGKWSTFDQEIYWANIAAWLLQPALLLHFALVFPARTRNRKSTWLAVGLTYALPAALGFLQIAVAAGAFGFVPWIGSRIFLDQLRLAYLGVYFIAAAGLFLRSYSRAPSGVLRQQLKWVTGGTFAAIGPFACFYIAPYFLGMVPRPWMDLSVLSLGLLPLCYGYAIMRYRLMDVDIIFKRGLAYTAATAGVVAVYFGVVGLIGELSHAAWSGGPLDAALAVVLAAFLLQPFRDWTQARLDHFFYRDRLNYRHTLIEFGRTLTNEVHLEPMLGSVMDRISQTLLVDRLAIFQVNQTSGEIELVRSLGLDTAGPLDFSYLSPARAEFTRGYLFYESPRQAVEPDLAVRHTIQQLDLNYYIPCRIRERTVAILGLGKTVDGDFLSSEDVELLFTIASYVAIALDNAQLYSSLEQKALQIERLKDFSENIVESLHVGVLAAAHDGGIESWNSQLETLLGVPRAEAMGRKLPEVLPADLVREIEARAEEQHVSCLYKFPLRNRDGRQLVVNISLAPLLGKGGEYLGRLILVEDVSERARLDDQLLETEKLTSLGLLAAGVAHEVNTPLAVISNYIQMLAKQLPQDDPRNTLIDKIVKQTFRASEIVNNLLNFSRTGSAHFGEVNLNAVLEETLSLVSHPFHAAQVEVVRQFQNDLPAVLGSTNRLQQVFLNLFMNARDAMPRGGMLEVRTACSNGTVEVEVNDTGVGISREHLKRIFDPFFTTKSSGRGTGLGLSVSYGIIREHAGKIDVRSAVGRGTSFRLEFPIARKGVHA